MMRKTYKSFFFQVNILSLELMGYALAHDYFRGWHWNKKV